MSSNGIKSNGRHPYILQKEATSPEPIEWKTVSDSWIRKYGGAVAKKALKKKLN
jgi:hypothetical protein